MNAAKPPPQILSPEIAVITDLDPEEPLLLSLASHLLEQGIFFSGLEQQCFLKELPDRLDTCKALLIQKTIYVALRDKGGADLDRLQNYAASGGHVFILENPQQGLGNSQYDELTSGKVSSIITQADLTMFHPEWARVQDERSTAEIVAGFKDRLLTYMSQFRANEFNLHAWKAALKLIATGAHEDVRAAMRDSVRRVYKTPPPGFNHDEVSGVFGTVWLHEQTGEDAALAQAIALMDAVIARRPRVAGLLASDGFEDDPLRLKEGKGLEMRATSRRTVVWTENMHMLCPGLAALTRVTGDPKYLDEGFKIARYIKENHQDEDGLIFHCTRDGKPVSSKWSRGQAHALYGAFYMLEEMDPADPRRALLIDLIRTTGRGLKKHQDPQSGLWRNVLDNRKSRLECSGSICFVYLLNQAIKQGLVDSAEYSDMVAHGLQGLKRLYWRGGLAANCRGTGTGIHEVYYLARPQGWARVPWFIMALLGDIQTQPGGAGSKSYR